jgi:hypothetical protein
MPCAPALDTKRLPFLVEACEQENNKDELKIDLQASNGSSSWEQKRDVLDAMISQGKHGRDTEQHTNEEWGREPSVFSSRINVLWSRWAEKRRTSTH